MPAPFGLISHRLPRGVIAALAVVVGLLVSLLGVDGASAQPQSEAQPTLQDIQQRDQLIANQENLLNTYRCMFGVDVDAVPGQCPNPTAVSPGAAPESPTRQDLAVRDQLIANQEALLNVYRCQFDIDTQLVPGGCASRPDPQPTEQPAGGFIAISAGGFHSCAIRADNTAVCWGDNRFGKADAPPGQYTAIAAGGAHTCGIRTDNTAVCWGANVSGRADAPAGQFTSITAGSGHSCAIRTDNTAVCWGYNWLGKADAPPGQYTSISAGTFHSCAIRTDNTAVCWGANESGQTDAPAGTFTAIAVGGPTRAESEPTTPLSAGGTTGSGRRTPPQANTPPSQRAASIRVGSEPTAPPSAGAPTN